VLAADRQDKGAGMTDRSTAFNLAGIFLGAAAPNRTRTANSRAAITGRSPTGVLATR
jgi:hypothetical protein